MSEATTTLDGWYCLHDLRSIDWAAWKTLSSDERGQAVSEFLNVVEKWNEVATAKKRQSCNVYSCWSKSRYYAYDLTSNNGRVK